jgi:hypothetical protein
MAKLTIRCDHNIGPPVPIIYFKQPTTTYRTMRTLQGFRTNQPDATHRARVDELWFDHAVIIWLR